MALGLSNNKVWYDKAFVSVSPVGGSEVEMRSFTTSFSVEGGDFDIEGLETFGGKITRVGSKNDIELSFETIPAGTRDQDWIFHGATSSATSITSSATVKYRVTALWTDQTGVTAATQAINTSSEAYRQIYSEAYCISANYSMDAGEHLTGELGFKLAYEDETGGQNFKKEMCNTSSALTAVPAYTTTTKF